MKSIACFDLTAVHLTREMELHRSADQLADPNFRRWVGHVSSAAERKSQVERLRAAAANPPRFRRFSGEVA